MVTGFTLPVIAPMGPEIFLAVVGCAVILADLIWKGQRYVVPVVVITGTLATILMAGRASGLSFNGMYTVDGYSAFFKVICLLGLLMAVLMSLRHLSLMGVKRVGEYYGLMLFSCSGMMVMASAAPEVKRIVSFSPACSAA